MKKTKQHSRKAADKKNTAEQTKQQPVLRCRTQILDTAADANMTRVFMAYKSM